MRVSGLIDWIPSFRPAPRKTLLTEVVRPVADYIKNNWDIILFYTASLASPISLAGVGVGIMLHLAIVLNMPEKKRKNLGVDRAEILAITAFLALNLATMRYTALCDNPLAKRCVPWMTGLILGFVRVPFKH